MSTNVEAVHLLHEIEQLRGRMLRQMTEHVDLLTTAAGAMRKGKVEVAAERIEFVIDQMVAEQARLRACAPRVASS